MSNRQSDMHRKNTNMTGCMGNIAHIFDFNQNLTVRKLLADSAKTYRSEGLDTASNIYSNDRMDERTKIILKGEHNGNNSSKQLREAPIKALIAEELSKGPYSSKNKAPSIVARLMGLDALPGAIMNKQKMKRKERCLQKLAFEELPNAKSGSYHESPEKVVLPHTSNLSDNSFTSGFNEEGHTLRNLDPERDPDEHGELDSPMIWKLEYSAQMQALQDNLDEQLVARQMLINSKLSEADSFAKLLDRTDSRLVARNLHNNGDNQISENVGGFAGNPTVNQSMSQSFGCKNDKERSPAFLPALFSTKNQHKHSFCNIDHNQNNTENAPKEPVTNQHRQVPTRIVVLKPGPNRVQNVKLFSKDSPPKGFLKESEIIKANSMSVLHDLRKRLLQLDDDLNASSMQPYYHHHNLPKVPKDVAQEITMRARESITKELMDNGVNLGTKLHYDGSGCTHRQVYSSSGREYTNMSFSSKSSSINVTNTQKETGSEQLSIWVRSLENQVTEDGYLETLPGNSGRHSVDETYPMQMCRNGPPIVGIHLDSRSDSYCDLEADGKGQIDHDMHERFLSRSFSVHGRGKEEGISGENSLGSRSKYPNGMMHKGNDKLADDDIAIWGSCRNCCKNTENPQCHIDDTGPILESSDSASSIEKFLSLESTTSDLKHVSQVESSSIESSTMCGNLRLAEAQIRKSIDPIDDSEIVISSPSLTSPREAIKLSSGRTMVANWKLNKDMYEQPSPVSVLDLPSHAESSNSVHFSDIRSRLHELRSRLQLSRYIDNETSSNPDTCEDDDSTDEDKSIKNCFHIEMIGRDHMENVDMLMDGIQYPQGREQELIYVRDLLVASGFADDNATTLVQWHASKLPLAYDNFERMADDYNNDSRLISKENLLPYHTQHILFDIVNEVLFEMFRPESSRHQWWKPQFGSEVVMPSGKLLLQTVWAGVCKVYSSSLDDQDTLGDLVANDLSGRDGWQDSSLEIAALAHDLESAIFDDLMLETITF